MNYQRRIAAIKLALGITFDKYEDENDPENMRSNLLGTYVYVGDQDNLFLNYEN